MSTKKWFAVMVILAFGSVISFFHVDSYIADKNGLNPLFIIGGILFGLLAIGCLYKVIKQGGTSSHRQ